MKYILYFVTALVVLTSATCKMSKKNTETAEVTKKAAKNDGIIKLHQYIAEQNLEQYDYAILAGGCFWCVEAVFERINGVADVVSGYAGGGKDLRPSYDLSNKGTTNVAESVVVFYDSAVVDYATLLDVFFIGHDPTTLNRQGADVGTQYRSTVFYTDQKQKEATEKAIAKWNESGKYDNPIVTTLEPYDQFWTAETYHQNYYELNPNQSYVMRVTRPKVEKVMRTVPKLLKKQYKPR